MFKKLLFTAVSIIAAIFNANAQTINGKVIDENSNPIEFATAAILSVQDSSVVSGASTDENGIFEISGTGDLLQISMIGFQTATIKLSSFKNGETIILNTDNELLSEAVVSAELPKTELKGNAVVTNIAGSVLAHSGNSFDVLKRVPGIISRDGTLEVIGRGAPVYYLNGHKVTDDTELKNLMSEDIKSIEVINNPGAEYGGEVRCVIRIRTIKRNGEGFGFSLTSEGTQHIYECTDFEPSSTILDLNYRYRGIDVFSKVSHWNTRGYQEAGYTNGTYIKSGDEVINNYQDGYLNYYGKFIGLEYTGGINWQINDNNAIGFKLSYDDNIVVKSRMTMDCKIYKNGIQYDNIISQNDENGSAGNFNGNIYYDGHFDKLSVNFNADFIRSGNNSETGITENSEIDPSVFTTNTNSQSGMGAGKLVISYPLWKGMLSAGAEETYVTTDEQYTITVKDIPSSKSSINENTIAGFIEYAAAFKFGQLSAGLRFERNSFNFTDFIDSKNDINRVQNNWFPSLSFATKAGPVTMSFSFTGKTIRPSFDILTSQIMYDNMFTYQTGDPKMKNELHRTLSLNANYKWLTFSSSYERTDNAVSQLAYPYNDEGVTIIQYTNVKEPYRQLSLYLIASPSLKIWYPNLTAGIQKQFYSTTVIDPRSPSGYRELSLNKPMYLIQFNNTFVLKHNWMIEANYQYLSSFNNFVVLITKPLQNATISVGKDFLKDKSLNIRLSWSDIFNSNIQYVECDYGNVVISQSNNNYTPCISLRASYRFNAAKSKYKGTGAGSDAKDRMK